MDNSVEPRIKGISFIDFGAYLRETHGEQGYRRVVEAVEPSMSSLLEKAYGHERYPLRALVECEKKYVEFFHGGDKKAAALFGKYDAIRQMATYRVILRHLSTPFLLKRGALIWKSYMDRGDFQVVETGPNRIELELSDYAPIDLVHCYENVGTFEACLEICGARNAKVAHLACRLDGAPACRYEASWE